MNTPGCAVQKRDAWWSRLVLTGVAFLVFVVGSLVLGLVVFPTQRLISRGPTHLRRKRARWIIHWSMRAYAGMLIRLRLLTLEIRGADRLERAGQMIVANHPSLLDVVFLLGQVRDANCIVKHGLFKHWVTRGPVRSAGYVANDGGVAAFDGAVQALKDGQTLIVFPEGTRTAPGAMPVFGRGACAIALRGATSVVPVVIRMNTASLTKGQPWYCVAPTRLHYVIDVGEAFDPSFWKQGRSLPRAGRALNHHLHQYFESRLKTP